MKWYQMNQTDIEEALSVNVHTGLTEAQVKQREKLYGLNELIEEKPLSKWIIFFKQFQDFMVLLLLAATLIAGLLGEYVDAIAIIVIVIINGCIGFFQEQRAERSLEKLKTLSAPLANVLRDESWQKIRAKELVIGDIVRLSRGNRVPADIRIVQTSSLASDESVLTGESLPVSKHEQTLATKSLPASNQENMCFKGTLITSGSALGIVVGIGMKTEMGKIAQLIATTKKVPTPLEMKLSELGKVLIGVVLMLIAFIVAIGILQGHPTYEMFLAGVSLAVAAIPEGLPAIVTVVLSLGVQRMIRKQAIIRKLSAVETLGSASVICSDKTGTITENKMTVKQLFLNNEWIQVTGSSETAQGDFYLNDQKITNKHPNLAVMLQYGMLCNQAQLLVKNGKYVIDGDPTDGALQIVSRKFGLNYTLFDTYKIVKEIPFDAKRKRMSVIVEDENGKRF
ncbi:MAG TPA: HAD-IC family P-type ATPase, partial [Bacillota bacterium]|nr:HAD-IC family P-type ATPase [Bacillota bacterium]